MTDSPFTAGYQPPRFRCPYCGSHDAPRIESKISTAGWVMFILLFIFLCWPLCWIPLFLRDDFRVCASCGVKIS